MSEERFDKLDEIEKEVVAELYKEWNMRDMSYDEFYNEIKDSFSYQRRVSGRAWEKLGEEIRCELPEFLFSSTIYYISATFLLGLAGYSIFIGEPLTAAFLSGLVLYFIWRR